MLLCKSLRICSTLKFITSSRTMMTLSKNVRILFPKIRWDSQVVPNSPECRVILNSNSSRITAKQVLVVSSNQACKVNPVDLLSSSSNSNIRVIKTNPSEEVALFMCKKCAKDSMTTLTLLFVASKIQYRRPSDSSSSENLRQRFKWTCTTPSTTIQTCLTSLVSPSKSQSAVNISTVF